ncbi:MAG: tetratricopeptide repeat protein [Gammaproteobacteria bacterium]
MKAISTLALVFAGTICFSQTQDIYLHNGDDYWNQRRLAAQRNLEYAREINAINEEKLAKMKMDAAGCAANLNQVYAQRTQFKPIPDGDYHVFISDNDKICSESYVKVSGGKITMIGDTKHIKVIWSSDITNQKAKINTSYLDTKQSSWVDVFFIFDNEYKLNDADAASIEEQKRQAQPCITNLKRTYSAITKFKSIGDGSNIHVYITNGDVLCTEGYVTVKSGKIASIGDEQHIKITWSSDISNQKAHIKALVTYDGGKSDNFEADIFFLFETGDEPVLAATNPSTESSPSNAFYKLAQKAERERNYVDAIYNYSECLKIDSDNIDAYFNRSQCKSNLQDRRGEINDLNEIIKREKTTHSTHFLMGTVYNNKADALLNLGRYDEAIPLVNHALQLAPNEAYIWDTRGEIYFKKKDYTSCIQDETKSIELVEGKKSFGMVFEPGHPYYLRGLAKIRLGAKGKGCEDLSKAGELGIKDAYAAIKTNCQ